MGVILDCERCAMTDIEIAQAAKPLPIMEVAARAGIDESFVECYGRSKAKIDPALLDSPCKDGKLVLVTAHKSHAGGRGQDNDDRRSCRMRSGK